MVNSQQTTESARPAVSFKTEFAVDMTCQSCVNAVTKALGSVDGVDKFEIDLPKKQVVVEGRAAPSQVTRALKETGRQTLIRGSGTLDGTHEGAAVAILESPLPLSSTSTTSNKTTDSDETQKVYGIARMVQVSTEPVLSLLDLSIRFPGYSSLKGQGPGSLGSSSPSPSASASTSAVKAAERLESSSNSDSYTLYVSKTGDLSNLHTHPYSTGDPLHTLTELRPDAEGYADKVLELAIPLWEVVGRGLVIERTADLKERMGRAAEEKEKLDRVKGVLGGKGRLGVLAGVIARSAGVWGNDKTVCACSGKTMWEEGRMMDSVSRV